MQHRREKEKIVLAYERDFEIWIASLFKFECSIDSPKAAAEN